ncbi:MAG: hypothetical protein M1118_04640, partial [Chloroflexi bacterium]|nr:hypothetical protein [Chloroflexota bacterium]
RSFYRVAAQVRYEASLVHHSPDDCPICGKTGEFSDVGDDVGGEVRDPLGLELCLHGTVRGRPVVHPSGSPVRGVKALASDFGVYFGMIKHADAIPLVGCVAILDPLELDMDMEEGSSDGE